MNWQSTTICFVSGTICTWIIYDIVAVIKGGVEATISRLIYSASFKYPAIPFAFGLLMGHFFL